MPIPGGTVHFVMRGSMAGGENFACGWWENHQGSQSAAQALSSLFGRGGWAGFLTAIQAMNPATMTITAVDAYVYGDGSGGATDSASRAVTDGQGGSSPVHPNQIALCLTIRAAGAGRSRRNRIYLPAYGISMDTDGLAATAQVTAVLDNFASVLSDGAPAVVSQKNSIAYLAVDVDADRVPDQQTGRRRSLSRARISRAV